MQAAILRTPGKRSSDVTTISDRIKKTKSELTAARVRELLDYDQETGILTWKAPLKFGANGRKTAKPGPRNAGIISRLKTAHQKTIAWCFATIAGGLLPRSQ